MSASPIPGQLRQYLPATNRGKCRRGLHFVGGSRADSSLRVAHPLRAPMCLGADGSLSLRFVSACLDVVLEPVNAPVLYLRVRPLVARVAL
jgi:hypothetical protein